MKFLEKVSDFVGKYMAVLVLAVAALALFAPGFGKLYQDQLREYTSGYRDVRYGPYFEGV